MNPVRKTVWLISLQFLESQKFKFELNEKFTIIPENELLMYYDISFLFYKRHTRIHVPPGKNDYKCESK